MQSDYIRPLCVGADTMWRHQPGMCNSEVSRIKDEDGNDWIEIKKTLLYGAQEPEEGAGPSKQKIRDRFVYLEEFGSTCKSTCINIPEQNILVLILKNIPDICKNLNLD